MCSSDLKFLYLSMSYVKVAPQLISFAELVKERDSTVRVTDDGLIYAVDLVMVVTGQSRDAAGMALCSLSEVVFSSTNLVDRNLPGKGNAHTKLLTFQNAIELVMVLPGRISKKTRSRFANVIRRYMTGNSPLVNVIQANAKSSTAVTQLARESQCSESIEDVERRRRFQDHELDLRIQESKRKDFDFFMRNMDLLNPNWKNDTRLLNQTKDHLKNIMFGYAY